MVGSPSAHHGEARGGRRGGAVGQDGLLLVTPWYLGRFDCLGGAITKMNESDPKKPLRSQAWFGRQDRDGFADRS